MISNHHDIKLIQYDGTHAYEAKHLDFERWSCQAKQMIGALKPLAITSFYRDASAPWQNC